jgi:hypothetical protein
MQLRYVFVFYLMKFDSIKYRQHWFILAVASWNGIFHLSPQENIFTTTLINIHYLYIINYEVMGPIDYYWLKRPKHNRNSMKRRFNLMKEQWSGISIVISTEINILNYLCQSDVLDIVLWDFDGTRLPWLNESGRLWFPVSAHTP